MRLAVLMFVLTTLATSRQSPVPGMLPEMLNAGQRVFGTMVQDKSAEGALALAADPRVDFVFYSMEQGPFDLDGLRSFLSGLRQRPGKSILVRIPPVGPDRQAARDRVTQLLDAGVDGIVFPHVRDRAEAEFAVTLLRSGERGVWPLDRGPSSIVGYFMIEDPDAVASVQSIAATPGIGILSGGQGSLMQAYKGNAAEVEAALQKILAACGNAQVVCAKLVTTGDIEQRFREGFRAFLAAGPALDLGRKLAGR